MTNGNDSAYPEIITEEAYSRASNELYGNVYSYHGLTKIEYFAAMAMQGLLARGDRDAIEMKSVLYAEALIAELNKQS